MLFVVKHQSLVRMHSRIIEIVRSNRKTVPKMPRVARDAVMSEQYRPRITDTFANSWITKQRTSIKVMLAVGCGSINARCCKISR
jgi:hypothetical protein